MEESAKSGGGPCALQIDRGRNERVGESCSTESMRDQRRVHTKKAERLRTRGASGHSPGSALKTSGGWAPSLRAAQPG